MPKSVTVTEDDKKLIVTLYQTRKRSITFISWQLQISADTVKNVLVEAGVQLRDKKQKQKETSIRALLEKEFEAGRHNIEVLAKKYSCTEGYARQCYNDWAKEQDANNSVVNQVPPGIDPYLYNKYQKYLTIDKLAAFAETIKIGDRINMRDGPHDPNNSSYEFGYPSHKKIVVTILAKYPHIAMTDHGAKQWVEIWDAVRRFGRAK